MGKIQQLEAQLSNQIAAGEVVERPASVVKELIENAIDANSTRVSIEVEEAGLAKIRIVDNGDGMDEEDAVLAFERHATSKIKHESDLFRITTLGFRGEALPSIASVSEMEIKTSTGENAGTLLKINGGIFEEKTQSDSRKGTEIKVDNLFFNTPARLKYMKTVHTELGNITDVVNRMALAHPHISFRLAHNGKKLLYTNGNGDLLQVLASIYGTKTARQMKKIHWRSIDFEIHGYIAKPEITRASRNYMSTIVNGRFIKNYPLLKAIQEGYHTLLPIGRYPIVLLHIEMDPLLVDVNVHPAKLEVRLSKEKELMQLITDGIQEALREETLIPAVEKAPKRTKVESEQQMFSFEHRTTPPSKPAVPETKSIQTKPIQTEPDQSEPVFLTHSDQESESSNLIREPAPVIEESVVEEPENEQPEAEEEKVESSRVPPLYPIGQMHGTYIMAQNENGLYIIDQHAAQERIKYEFFREKVGEVEPEVQELLMPLTFEFSRDECLAIEAHLDELQEVGIFLETFGPQSYIVRSHPRWFPKGFEQEVIEEIIEQVIQSKKVDLKKLREEAAIMMSCKKSIKANHHLRQDEIFELLETLRKSTDPFTCPHGRPIILHFSTYEMEKMFKRIM
ncbi:DNA mismatch repair endonuclease MutL [Bacillus tianshenii]|nr:DNA mismatch repair endonuclease MutL [Bacillus tianshenii]